MNKKKNQTSIDLDAIMTEVLNLFTPEEQQEVIDILSNNGLEKIYQQMEEAFYHYQHPDYSSEATPIAAYLQRLWDMQTCKDYPFDEFKKDCTTVPAAELAYIIHSGFISGYQNRYGDNLKPPTNVYHRMTA